MPRDWLIVGADGGIGSALAERLPDAVRTSRRGGSDTALSLDLAGDPCTWELPASVSVAFLCAAVTSIEACRANPAETRFVNVERTTLLARMLADRGAFPVFLSTNQVFDGSAPCRKSDDAPCPRTEYGRQKADAERIILGLGGAVVRLTKVIAGVPPLFRRWIESLQAGSPVEAFDDMVFAPVPMASIVDVLVHVASRQTPGIVHASGERDISFADAARLLGDPGLVQPIGIASRGISSDAAPRHTTLDTTGLAVHIPPVRQTIESLRKAA